MKALKFARAWRWVLAGLIGCQGVSAGLDLFWWHTYMLVLFPVVLSCALVFAVRVNARTIANLEVAERARWRPDYAHIARMEREIYGETFSHDGAPEGGGWRIVGAQMEVSHPIASGADLAAAMAALGDTMREASVSIGHARMPAVGTSPQLAGPCQRPGLLGGAPGGEGGEKDRALRGGRVTSDRAVAAAWSEPSAGSAMVVEFWAEQDGNSATLASGVRHRAAAAARCALVRHLPGAAWSGTCTT